jgi:hypothetical protein
MSAVVSAIGDAIGGIVEGVGDVVEGIGDVLGDIGSAIDDYVIQPILDDPLTAIATVAGAAILGPMIAPALGGFGAAAGAIGAGLGAAAGNTSAGLVQGEDFDEAIKGGLIAGVTSGLTQGAFDYFGGSGAAAVPDEVVAGAADDPLGAFLAKNNNFADIDVGLPGGTGASTSAVPPPPSIAPTTLNPIDDIATSSVDDVVASSLDDAVVPPVPKPGPTSPLKTLTSEAATPDYAFSLKAPRLDPNAALPRDMLGNIDYSLTAGMQNQGGIGLQLPSSPSIASMGGGQGLTLAQEAIPDFTYGMNSLDPSIRGMSDSWVGESGKLYGTGSPAGKIGEYGFTAAPKQFSYELPSVAPKTLGDKLKNFDFDEINTGDMKSLAGKAVDYAIENPLTTLAGITLATGVLSQDAPPNSQPNPGSTRDPSFTRPMDQYNYMRQQQQYGGDFTKYGQAGGEHKFFTPSRFELITPPAAARDGGLMQMRQAFQAGGRAAPMNPRMMQTGMPAGGMGRGMPMRGGLEQAMQTGNMPPAGSSNMPQGRPQPVNRNPRTSYYQYGTPPGGAPKPGMADGGALNMVRSYNIGGGADGRSDDVDAVLSDGEYVFDAETVALLGNGSSEAGADRLDQMREQIRKQKGKHLAQGKISPDAQSPLSYLKRS